MSDDITAWLLTGGARVLFGSAVLGLLWWIFSRLERHGSASLRYALGISSVGLLLVIALALNGLPYSQTQFSIPEVPSATWEISTPNAQLLVGIWIVGSVLAVSRLAWGERMLQRQRLRARVPAGTVSPLWEDQKRRLTKHRPVELLMTSETRSPAFVGPWKPTVYLPEESAFWKKEQLEPVLWHERAHAERRDDWTLRCLLGLRALFWWNPFFALITRLLDEWREEAADEWALAHWPYPRAYARALVQSATTSRGEAERLMWGGPARTVEKRIRAIQDQARQKQKAPHGWPTHAPGMGLVILGLIALVSLAWTHPTFRVAPSLNPLTVTAPSINPASIPLPGVWRAEEWAVPAQATDDHWRLYVGPEIAPGRHAVIAVRYNAQGRITAFYPMLRNESVPTTERL